jgi:hypothetical protein
MLSLRTSGNETAPRIRKKECEAHKESKTCKVPVCHVCDYNPLYFLLQSHIFAVSSPAPLPL